MSKKKRNIIIAIMVSMFLAAFEGTVVTTAMPTIAKSLNGYNLMSWVFSSYLLTSAVSTPIYGKMSDLYGRKKMLSIGIVIFLIGSALCGFSQSMIQLIAFRAIQGIGAGSILTVTYTIVGDVFDLEERSKVQGCLSTVWGVSSLLGPFIGGFFIGLIMQISVKTSSISPHMKLLLTTGFLGGLTTFSTFSYETLMLVEGGEFVFAMINIILNLFLSLGGVSFGKFIIK